MSLAPLVLHIPTSRLKKAYPVAWHVLAGCRRKRALSARVRASFRFKNDEERFARQLVRRKSSLWVFRCNQQGFCGDFVVVDMSSPDPGRRPVFVIDLKQGAPLKVGGGGAGVQFRNAVHAVDAVARRTGAVPRGAEFVLLSGDRGELLAFLCSR